jgi:hypothetical protein
MVPIPPNRALGEHDAPLQQKRTNLVNQSSSSRHKPVTHAMESLQVELEGSSKIPDCRLYIWEPLSREPLQKTEKWKYCLIEFIQCDFSGLP